MKLLQKNHIAIAILVLVCQGAFILADFEKEEPKQEPIFLGTEDGKSFLYINSPMNWTEALSHCAETRGRKLASVKTSEQRDLIINGLRTNGFTKQGTWTAARQYLDPSAFVWHNTVDRLNEDVVAHWKDHSDPYSFCIALNVIEDPYGYDFYTSSCSALSYALCEE